MSDLNRLLSLSGGLMMGASAGLRLLLNGRVAGIPGPAVSLAGVARGGARSLASPSAFLVLLIGGPLVGMAAHRLGFDPSPAPRPNPQEQK